MIQAALGLTGILTNSNTGLIPQLFSMFGQLINYILVAPTDAIGSILNTWGKSFFHYGLVIPIIFTFVLIMTGLAVTFILQVSRTAESLGNVAGDMGAGDGDMGAGEAALAIPVGFLPLYTFPAVFTSVISAFITGILTLFQDITQGIDTGVSNLVHGILGAFGSPFHYWTVSVSGEGLMVPIIFVSILMFAGIIVVLYLNVQGYEQDVYSAAEALTKI